MKTSMGQQGFLLMEVLIAVLILSIAFVSFTAVLAQVLRVDSRARNFNRALEGYEKFLFEMENGQRSDLVTEGGQGPLGEEGRYDFQSLKQEGDYFFLKGRVSWKNGKDSLDLDAVFPGVSAQ